MYSRGVERLQPKLTLTPRFHYFQFPPNSPLWQRKMACFDSQLWASYEMNLPDDASFSLDKARIAQIGPRVYAFQPVE